MAWNGVVWHGMAWNGMEWRGMAWYGVEWRSTPCEFALPRGQGRGLGGVVAVTEGPICSAYGRLAGWTFVFFSPKCRKKGPPVPWGNPGALGTLGHPICPILGCCAVGSTSGATYTGSLEHARFSNAVGAMNKNHGALLNAETKLLKLNLPFERHVPKSYRHRIPRCTVFSSLIRKG